MGVLDPSNAELTFPSAEYVIGETELGYWTQPKHPLENDARGDIYSENIKTIAKIKDKIRTVKAGCRDRNLRCRNAEGVFGRIGWLECLRGRLCS